MAQRETRYVKRDGGGYIAYQVLDGGPVDLLYMSEWVIPIHAMAEQHLGRFLHRLNGFARVIAWDRPGVGQSDPLPAGERPMLERWVDDTIAVMDAVGVERAAVLGSDVGGQLALLFAATHPERTSAVVLANTCARFRADDDYQFGVPPEDVEGNLELAEALWGHGYPPPEVLAPNFAADRSFLEWSDQAQRLGASPATGRAILEMSSNLDLRPVLPSIRVPTLVMHSRGDRLMPVEHGRYIAEHIPEAKYVELPGADHPIFLSDADAIADEIEAFLTGVRGAAGADRVVATVLFTDIVASTELANRLGDRRWRMLLDEHDHHVRRQINIFRGDAIASTGDGVLATFDGPGRAIRCALAIVDAGQKLGLEIRAGLHAGEIELRGGRVAGLAVHTAARVAAAAGAGEVLVSRTVADLVAGSGIDFDDRGEHGLKGVPGTWRLFAVQRPE